MTYEIVEFVLVKRCVGFLRLFYSDFELKRTLGGSEFVAFI